MMRSHHLWQFKNLRVTGKYGIEVKISREYRPIHLLKIIVMVHRSRSLTKAVFCVIMDRCRPILCEVIGAPKLDITSELVMILYNM